MVLIFLDTTFFRLFEAVNRQTIVAKITGICMVANILLNFLLIPPLSYIGASIATLITECLVVVLAFVLAYKYKIGYTTQSKKLADEMFKVIIASLAMGIYIGYFKGLNLMLIVLSAMSIYLVGLYIFKGITKEDISLIVQALGMKIESDVLSLLIKKIKNKIKDKIKMFYLIVFHEVAYRLKEELSECNTVLDLGCGKNSPIRYCNIPFSIGVELFEPYLQESKKKNIHTQHIKGDIRHIEFKPKPFDAVIALDVLEHLSKEEGYELIRKMERWARKKL